VFLLVRWVSHEEQIVRSSSLIQIANLYLLMGKGLRQLTFHINNEKYRLIHGIFFAFDVYVCVSVSVCVCVVDSLLL
jgi:hypothetical protein